MKKRADKFYNDPWDPDFYETGSTRPPKNRGGLIAFLLVLVILLGGMCSTLGIINIHLLRQIGQEKQHTDRLYLFEEGGSRSEEPLDTVLADGSRAFPGMGLEGQTVSDFDRRFYELPYGVLVVGVTLDAAADVAGLRAGDVIVGVGGYSVTSDEELLVALEAYGPGQQVRVDFYRQQTEKNMSVTITLPEE